MQNSIFQNVIKISMNAIVYSAKKVNANEYKIHKGKFK